MYESADGQPGQGLIDLIDRSPRPPPVTATLPDGQVHAVLLVWAALPGHAWAGGIAYLHRTWHDRALVTMWVPASCLQPHASHDYRQVPRVRLPGDPSRWPVLPPRYPHAGDEWTAAHRHTSYGAPPR